MGSSSDITIHTIQTSMSSALDWQIAWKSVHHQREEKWWPRHEYLYTMQIIRVDQWLQSLPSHTQYWELFAWPWGIDISHHVPKNPLNGFEVSKYACAWNTYVAMIEFHLTSCFTPAFQLHLDQVRLVCNHRFRSWCSSDTSWVQTADDSLLGCYHDNKKSTSQQHLR